MVASGPFTSNATLCRQGSSRVRQSRARAGWALATRPRCGAHLRVTALRGDTYKTRTQNTSPKGARGVRNYNLTPGSATRAHARARRATRAQRGTRARASATHTRAARERAHAQCGEARNAGQDEDRHPRRPRPSATPSAQSRRRAASAPAARRRAPARHRQPPPTPTRTRQAASGYGCSAHAIIWLVAPPTLGPALGAQPPLTPRPAYKPGLGRDALQKRAG